MTGVRHGHQRTAWTLARQFLRLHGHTYRGGDAAAVLTMLQVAAGEIDQDRFTARLCRHSAVPECQALVRFAFVRCFGYKARPLFGAGIPGRRAARSRLARPILPETAQLREQIGAELAQAMGVMP